jgi:hypothetical protein
VINKHGVLCSVSNSGFYGHYEEDLWDGKKRFVSNVPILIPQCCIECCNFDNGEFGDYGERLSPPYCMRNIWFPIRKGYCKYWNIGLKED